MSCLRRRCNAVWMRFHRTQNTSTTIKQKTSSYCSDGSSVKYLDHVILKSINRVTQVTESSLTSRHSCDWVKSIHRVIQVYRPTSRHSHHYTASLMSGYTDVEVSVCWLVSYSSWLVGGQSVTSARLTHRRICRLAARFRQRSLSGTSRTTWLNIAVKFADVN